MTDRARSLSPRKGADDIAAIWTTLGGFGLAALLVLIVGLLRLRAREPADRIGMARLASDCDEQAARLHAEADEAAKRGDHDTASKRRLAAAQQSEQAKRLRKN